MTDTTTSDAHLPADLDPTSTEFMADEYRHLRLLQETLWEIEQIKQLKARYFRLMDTKRWVEWRSLFTEDMRFWNDNEPDPEGRPPIVSSGDAFVSMVSKVLADAVTVHQGHMAEIELTGARTAMGVWAMYDWVDDPSKNLRFEGWGHYHDKYEKGDDGAWRIKDMHLTRLRTITKEEPR